MKRRIWTALPLILLLFTGCERGEDPAYVASGMDAVENMDYETAIQYFDEAIEAQKDQVAALRGKGIAYMGLGDYVSAVEAFDSALSLTDEKMPDTIRDIRYYKASALYKAEKYDDTITVCSEMINSAPEGDAYYLRGACFMAREEYDQAKVDFDNAVKCSPGDYDLYLNIYGCYLEKNRSADGDVYLKKALSIQDSSKEANYQKARIYFYLEDYDRAKSYLDGLVEEKNQEAMELMGQIYLAMEDTIHARKIYEDCIAAFGETPEYDNGLVLCDLADEDYDGALEHIARGRELPGEEGQQELLYNSIIAWEYKGDFEMARQKAEEYVAVYPADERGQREYTFLQSR